jgi:hypothetical protein
VRLGEDSSTNLARGIGECRRKRSDRRQRNTGAPELVSPRCAKRSGVSRFIRRITDGVVAENQGKATGAGDVRVTLFPSKYSRVRPPGPRARKSRHPLSKPETRASGLPLEAGWRVSHLPGRKERLNANPVAQPLTCSEPTTSHFTCSRGANHARRSLYSGRS